MGSAYGDGGAVVAHKLPEKLSPCKFRDIQRFDLLILRVVGSYGSCEYGDVYVRCDILTLLPVEDLNTFPLKILRNLRPVAVGTGYIKTRTL